MNFTTATTINATINTQNFGAAATRLDIWHEGGGIGHWELEVDNITGASQILSANLVASNLGINGVDLMHGYVDDVLPEVKDASAVFSKYVKVTGRNYGRDLARLFLIYKFAATKFDDLVHDALLWTGSEISYTSPSTAPVVDADFNKTMLQNGLVDAAKLVDYDFVVDNAKTLFLWPLTSAPYSGVLLKAIAGATDNNILLINPEIKAGVDIRNYVRADAGTLNDHYTEGNASDWTGVNCTASDDSSIKIVGSSSIKATIITNLETMLYLQFPKYNHQSLDFSGIPADLSLWLYHDCNIDFFVYLKDDAGNEILSKCPVSTVDNWSASSHITVKVGTGAPFGTEYPWEVNKWHYKTGSNFTWNIKRLGIWCGGIVGGTHFFNVDGLKIDGVDVYAIAQDIAGSQATYGRSMIPLTRTDVKSQLQLQDIADTELIVRKDPVYKLTLTCTLQTGLLYAGYLVDVLAPNAYIGYDSTPVTYRILSLHHTAAPGEDLCMGHDAITVLELVRHDGGVGADPTRFKLASSPQAAINTRYDSRLRVLEGSLTGSGSVVGGGGGGGAPDWMNVPYIKVLGSAFFEALTQLECDADTYSWAELEPYLWGFSGGVWTPDALEMPQPDSYLRFKDNLSENYLDLFLIFSEMDPESPILFTSQHLMCKKDFSCGGMIGSNQGCLNLGSGLQSITDMPQIILGHSETAYSSMDTLEINRSGVGTLHRARNANVATIGTSSAHLLIAGDAVKIHGIGGSGYDGEWYVLAVPNSTHFTYTNSGSNENETASLYGSITGLAKLKVKTAYVDYLKKVNGDDWTFPWNGGTVTNPIVITSASEPLLTLNDANAKIEFLNDCDLYRKVVSSIPILATDNAFTCAALTCLGIAGSSLGLSIADGTAPITTVSTTVCTNLHADNSDHFDGHHWSDVPSAYITSVTSPLSVSSGVLSISSIGYGSTSFADQNLLKASNAIFASVMATATAGAGLKLGLADGTTYGALAYESTKVNLIAYGRTLFLATDSGYGVEVQRNLTVDGDVIIGAGYNWNGNIRKAVNNDLLFINGASTVSKGGEIMLGGQDFADAGYAGRIKMWIGGDKSATPWGYLEIHRVVSGGSADILTLDASGNLTLAGSLYGSGGVTTIGNDMVAAGNIKINKTNPVLNFDVADDLKLAVGFNGTYSFINEYTSGDLMISTLYGGGIILAPAGVSGTGDVRVWGGHHLLPQTVNTGQVGNSGLYFYAMYSNWFYGKNNGLFGCERSKSGEEWAHEFSTREQAEEYLTHEITKTKYHVEYDLKTEDKIVCTCGKSVFTPCPEHMDEWADKYTVNTGKLVQASSFLVLELDEEVARLRVEVDDLRSQLNEIKSKGGIN